MKKYLLILSALFFSFQLTAQSAWTNLSDGTFDHWHVYNHPGEPVSSKWTIDKEGAFVFDPNGSSDWNVNDIVTNEDYEDFELQLEWKIGKGGNSGIFYGVIEDQKLHTPYMSGPEIQVLDDENHPDAKQGKNNNRKGGSLYDMIPSASAAKPYDQWNSVTIKRKDNIITIWQNGVLAVTYPTSGEGWDAMVENSKFKGWEHFGKYSIGKIGLQDHGNVVSFRNIRIREL
ncbi:3-keto-disaccharide hydrolase [Jiulongibacter sediminis]|uniref:Glycosyl hydrolase n=1 Tax=Jiulongibacter sediminis TaxID=1605367 RepID=A0A0P7BY05_9BACT|nr:DUF1080 domain-containing protein [Jiulongibacter sediminis]KPM49395.1 glycosyl hydrolase [Jiulongibacter sediminis]TBX26444.1 glycosyl hydrolase [Jiulongibacter sediminis]